MNLRLSFLTASARGELSLGQKRKGPGTWLIAKREGRDHCCRLLAGLAGVPLEEVVTLVDGFL